MIVKIIDGKDVYPSNLDAAIEEQKKYHSRPHLTDHQKRLKTLIDKSKSINREDYHKYRITNETKNFPSSRYKE